MPYPLSSARLSYPFKAIYTKNTLPNKNSKEAITEKSADQISDINTDKKNNGIKYNCILKCLPHKTFYINLFSHYLKSHKSPFIFVEDPSQYTYLIKIMFLLIFSSNMTIYNNFKI